MYKCCSSSNQCGLNEGDCDSDSECSGNLICGKDNCQSPFPSDVDCCVLPGNFTLQIGIELDTDACNQNHCLLHKPY